MNKYLLLLFFSSLLTTVWTQNGIRFADKSWEQALTQASAEDKLIFLDANTAWCGPCRMMEEDVFTDKEVGKYFNRHFVNLKIDMESSQGLPLAVKFNIRAYPSLLFINGAGEVVHRVTGYHDAGQLLEVGQVANDPKERLSGLQKRYEEGERDPDFLIKLIMSHANAMDGKHMEPLEAYFDTQQDWSTFENMELLFTLADDIDSPLFAYVASHRPAFERMFGKTAVVKRLQYIVNQELYKNDTSLPSLDRIDELYRRVYPDLADQLSAKFRMDYYRQAGDQQKYLQATIEYMEQYSSTDAKELNNAAWHFFEMVEDKDQLRIALDWARQSVSLEPSYYNHDTLAALYYKLGEHKKARKIAKEAIEIAKANGEDYAPTQALLETIKLR